MSDAKRGEIIDYEVPPDVSLHDPAFSGTVPMLVHNVDEEGNVSGLAFVGDGSIRPVVIPVNPPETDETRSVADIAATLDKMGPAERGAFFQAMQQLQNRGAPAPAPEPAREPESAREPAPETAPRPQESAPGNAGNVTQNGSEQQ